MLKLRKNVILSLMLALPILSGCTSSSDCFCDKRSKPLPPATKSYIRSTPLTQKMFHDSTYHKISSKDFARV